ncbi:P-loop containing nucleoside triphosphate hydrolase protein [Tricladium varicosporioides]|nr:P-loop containing nucleoside triphosphate hydrolase protein [Hymenoscyphus varicosporioides]
MDRIKHPVFIRQYNSKAIPIINPDSNEKLSTPAALQKPPGKTFPGSLHPAVNVPSPEFSRSSQDDTNTSSSPARSEKPGDEGIKQAFNIYARPFIPESFTIINGLTGHEINSPAIKQINFGEYISRFIGFNFLPPVCPPIKPPLTASFDLVDNVIQTHYEHYFQYHLEAEIRSQKQENETYSLYGHDVTMLLEDLNQRTYSFLVPGLRENCPYVEEDDVIQLRQLHYDHRGRLLGMEHWLNPSPQFSSGNGRLPIPGGRWRGEPAPGWTGKVYNARVLAVERKKMKLVIRLSHPPSLGCDLKFNIQFPITKERYLPMQQVLPIAQEALRLINRSGFGNQHQVNHRSVSVVEDRGQSPEYNPWLHSMLFPAGVDSEVQNKLNTGTFNRPFFDKQLNWEQKKAVESICAQNYGTLPFLISGPPGTGKTKTLIEVALQLLKHVDKASHIIFCAPSDPAADTIVQRIRAYFRQTELLRLNRPTRTFSEVPGSVLPFCYISKNKFDLPPFNEIMACKLIVTTCRDASMLLYSRLTNRDLYAAEYGPRNSIHPYSTQFSKVELHWTALLIDEAAQAMEPEALIPLSIVSPPLKSVQLARTPLFVMAGDEHQLGPRTSLPSSPLKYSLFARLFVRPVYASHPLARGKNGKAPPALTTSMLPIGRPAFANLIRNYRSHPAILAVPSALFYSDTLEPEATNINCLAPWNKWRRKGWPVLFHNNTSEDELEKDGGGWYNLAEVQIACQYAASIVKTGLVNQTEVCIMSPFKAQVQCLRKSIREEKYGSLWDVDVGPTEAFQGLERGVVILCTTRSKQQFVENDKSVDWGIIGLPNKMNVALTRAKFGLVVIGRREILDKDPNWKAFLGFCDPLKVVSQEDEMWENEMQVSPSGDMNGYEFNSQGYQ